VDKSCKARGGEGRNLSKKRNDNKKNEKKGGFVASQWGRKSLGRKKIKRGTSQTDKNEERDGVLVCTQNVWWGKRSATKGGDGSWSQNVPEKKKSRNKEVDEWGCPDTEEKFARHTGEWPGT